MQAAGYLRSACVDLSSEGACAKREKDFFFCPNRISGAQIHREVKIKCRVMLFWKQSSRLLPS